MNPAISGLYAITPDLADTALFGARDVELAAREFCELFREKVA